MCPRQARGLSLSLSLLQWLQQQVDDLDPKERNTSHDVHHVPWAHPCTGKRNRTWGMAEESPRQRRFPTSCVYVVVAVAVAQRRRRGNRNSSEALQATHWTSRQRPTGTFKAVQVRKALDCSWVALMVFGCRSLTFGKMMMMVVVVVGLLQLPLLLVGRCGYTSTRQVPVWSTSWGHWPKNSQVSLLR